MILRLTVSERDDDILVLEICRNTKVCPGKEHLLNAQKDELEWWDHGDGPARQNWDNFCWLSVPEFKTIFKQSPVENMVYLVFMPNWPDDVPVVEEEFANGQHQIREILLSNPEIAYWTAPGKSLADSIYNKLLGYPEDEEEDD